MSSTPTKTDERWSPYAVGAGIGALTWVSLATVDKPIGVSMAIARTAGMIGRAFAPRHYARNAYFQKEAPLTIDWEWMLALGIPLGSLVGSLTASERPRGMVPETWRREVGPSRAGRILGAFVGGAAVMFGARLAGGCTSGHGISGTLHLAASSWIFTAMLFAAAIPTARILYGKEARHGR